MPCGRQRMLQPAVPGSPALPKLLLGTGDVLPRKTRRGIKGTRLRAKWALIPVAPPDMTTTSPGLSILLDLFPKTAEVTCPSEVKTLPSRCTISTSV